MSDSDDDHLWTPPADRRSGAYSFEVQDEEESSDDEAILASRRTGFNAAHALAQDIGMGGQRQTGAAGAAQSASAARPQEATAGVRTAATPTTASPRHVTFGDTPMPTADSVDGDDSGSDMSDDGDVDDDEELGGSEGDLRFQRMLEQMQSAAEGAGGAAGATEPDLLSQILKGAHKPSSRSKEGDESTDAHTGEQPGAIADDVVDYQIYVDGLVDASADIDANAVVQRLAAFRAAVLAFLAPTTAEHIWQQQPLQLQVCAPHLHSAAAAAAAASSIPASAAAAPPRSAFHAKHSSTHSRLVPHLHGSSYFGDNIDDEWLIVYLLLTLSSHFSDIAICLSDSDGSFLCIELAEVLPEWLARPEVAAGRVWIRRGQVHFIPLPHTPALLSVLPARPSLEQSLALLRDQVVPTAASSDVLQALLSKLAPYFAAATRGPTPFALASPSLSSAHECAVALPLSLAALLHRWPQLVAQWAGAFCARDGVDMARAGKMERILGPTQAKRSGAAAEEEEKSKATDGAANHTSSSSSVVPFVFYRARFTHCLYAQLSQQRWAAPRCFTRHQAALTTSSSVSEEGFGSRTAPGGSAAPSGSRLARALDLGSKLSAGAEIWYANTRAALAKRGSRARAARERLGGSAHPEVVRRDQAVALALTINSGSVTCTSSQEVEDLLSTESSPADLLDSWRAFLAECTARNLAKLVALESSTAEYWRTMLLTFLASRYQGHQCFDHESVDEALVDPEVLALLALEDAATQFDSCANMPPMAAVIRAVDQVCEATNAGGVGTDPAASAALPAPFNSAAAAGSLSLSSLPPDDSDAWLTLDPSELDALMAQASAAATAAASTGADDGGGNASMSLSSDGDTIVKAMHKFVDKRSEIEGVEAPSTTKSAAASKSHTHTATQPSAARGFQPLNVDTDELMRLLAGVQAEAANFGAYAPASVMSDALGSSSAPSASSIQPEDDAKKAAARAARVAALLAAEDGDLTNEPQPTRLNTRPPENDAYKQVWHSEAPPTIETTEGKTQASYSTLAALAKQTPTSTPSVPITAVTPATATSASDADDVAAAPTLRDYMQAMDDELQGRGLQSDFVRESEADDIAAGKSDMDTATDAAASSTGPVHVDANLLANLLRSHDAEREQTGAMHAGPATAVLASMGITLPNNDEQAKKRT